MRSKGFLLAEALLSVFVMSLMMSLTLSAAVFTDDPFRTFPDAYLRTQSESILTGKEQILDSDSGYRVRFTGAGNVDLARTLSFVRHGRERKIIIELGGGRLVIRK